jgi:hypothetical protein
MGHAYYSMATAGHPYVAERGTPLRTAAGSMTKGGTARGFPGRARPRSMTRRPLQFRQGFRQGTAQWRAAPLRAVQCV